VHVQAAVTLARSSIGLGNSYHQSDARVSWLDQQLVRSRCKPASQGTVGRDCLRRWLPGSDGWLDRLYSTELRPRDQTTSAWGAEARARPPCSLTPRCLLHGVQ